jgi:hypothetical protein
MTRLERCAERFVEELDDATPGGADDSLSHSLTDLMAGVAAQRLPSRSLG